MLRITKITRYINIPNDLLPLKLVFWVRGIKRDDGTWCFESVFCVGAIAEPVGLDSQQLHGGLGDHQRTWQKWYERDYLPLGMNRAELEAALEEQYAKDTSSGKLQGVC